MKRPSGFDRAPEEPTRAVRAEGSEPTNAAEPSARPWSLRRFGGRNELSRDGASGAVDGAEGSADSAAKPRADSGVADTLAQDPPASLANDPALTVDLSEVRAERSGLVPVGRGVDPVRDAERRMRAATRSLRRRERRERRRFSLSTRQRRRSWLIGGGVVVALAAFIAVGVFTPVMAVRTIEISGAETVNAADLEQALTRLTGTPLALVDDDEVRQALEPFPLVQRYAVERIPPHTLLVRVEERTPVISIAEGDGYRQYDAAGVLVGGAEAPPPGVPVADGRVTDRTSDAFTSSALVLRDMPADLRAQITSVTAASGEDVTLTLANGIEVMWGGSSDTARKAVVLSTMMTSLAGTAVSYIDVSSSEAPVFR